MIKSTLKGRYRKVRRTSAHWGIRFAPLMARELKKAAKDDMNPKDELDFSETFLNLTTKFPPRPDPEIDSILRETKKRVRELKG